MEFTVLLKRSLSDTAGPQAHAPSAEMPGYLPDAIVTGLLQSYGASLRDIGLAYRHVAGGRPRTAGKSLTSLRVRENASGADFDRLNWRYGTSPLVLLSLISPMFDYI